MRGTARFPVFERAALWAFLVPVSLAVLGAPRFLQSPMNVYDGGLLLTLARFTSFTRLPYRDLWTLYGPGPQILGTLVSRAFGPGLLPSRISFVVVQLLLVTALYLLTARYLNRWWAVLFASVVATFGFQHVFHFNQSLVFLLWGLWFVLRAEDDERKAGRRAATGAFLLGMVWWGRFELLPVAVVLVAGMWWFLRPRLSVSAGRWILVAGLVPTVLFGLYLLAIVGWNRVHLNLIDFPFTDYPRLFCRGVRPVWGEAFEALLAPFHARLWTSFELTLWVCTFLPPLLGLAVLAREVGMLRTRSYRSFVALTAALMTLLLWLEHRPRVGAFPYPLWPMVLLCAAILLAPVRRRRPTMAAGTGLALGLLLLMISVTSWLPGTIAPVTHWPRHHELYGFAQGEDSGLHNEAVWSQVRQQVQYRVPPEGEIFVALTNNTSHLTNAPIFYWLTDRPPASRFIEFNPCLTDTASVQREIIRDLSETEVIITTTFFTRPRPPALGPAPRVLDEYLAANFSPVYRGELGPEGQAVYVLARDEA